MSSKKTIITNNILFVNNINKIVNENGGSYVFADKIGVSYDAVRQWRIGENLPDGKRCLAIRNEFGISIDWLLAGSDPEPVKITLGINEETPPYGTPHHSCPVNCDGNLREICRSVKYVIEDDGEFAEALKANIKAFKKSVELDRRVKNLERSLSSGQGGGIPQAPARSTARKRKAR